jgi:hypothetical protein
MATSILGNLDASQIVLEPYPHVVVRDALDHAYYAELDAAYPELNTIAGDGPLPNNKLYNRSAHDIVDDMVIPEIWRDFFAYHTSRAFLKEVLAFWAGAIALEYPDLEARAGRSLAELTSGIRRAGRQATPENLDADVMLDCQFGINSPVTVPTSVRVPHVDNPFKLFAGLLYFRSPDDRSDGGDLTLFRIKDEGYCHDRKLNVPEHFIERFAEVPYRANTFIMWLNTQRSLHGVTPRSMTDMPRRYVNFLGESYRLQSGGFFPIKQSRWSRGLEAGKRFLGAGA